MASALLARLRGVAQKAQAAVVPPLRSAEKFTAEHYTQMLKNNEQYIVKDPAAADKLFKQLVFTNLARIPTGLKTCNQEWQQVQSRLAKRSDLTAAEVGTYALFAGEVYAWFCVGEIVGRGGSIGGYNI